MAPLEEYQYYSSILHVSYSACRPCTCSLLSPEASSAYGAQMGLLGATGVKQLNRDDDLSLSRNEGPGVLVLCGHYISVLG